MDTLAILKATEEIKFLKARYWRYIDTRQWEEYRTLFAPDATLHFPDASPEPTMVDDTIEWTAGFLEGSVSIHRGYAPEIEILSETEAKGIWAFEDQIYWEPGAPNANNMSVLQGHGHYHETYVCLDGSWKIKTLLLSRLRAMTQTYGISV